MILKLQRADGVRDLLHRIFDWMCKVIHRIDAPLISRVVVRHPRHPVDDRVAHIDVRRRHVNLCPEHLLSILILSVLHRLEQRKVLLYRTVPVRTVLSGLCERSPVLPDLVSSQVAHISLSVPDQFHGTLIHHVKIVRRIVKMVFKICAEPLHVFFYGLHILHVFFRRICVVKPKVECSVIFFCQSGI